MKVWLILAIFAITAHQKFATLMRAFVYSNAESFITAALLFPLLYLWVLICHQHVR